MARLFPFRERLPAVGESLSLTNDPIDLKEAGPTRKFVARSARFALMILGILFWCLENLPAQQWPMEVIAADLHAPMAATGDFDRDQDTDVLSRDADSLIWYENRTGNWDRHTIDIGFPAQAMGSYMVLDVDNDGDLDFTVLALTFGSEFSWYENRNNAAEWRKHIIAASLNFPGRTRSGFGDIDGDGDLDIALSVFGDGRLVWFENLGGGTVWQERGVAFIGSEALWTTLVDIDGDGDLDIVGARYTEGGIQWYENQLPNPSWPAHFIANLPGTALGECADLDGDGDKDLITASNMSNALVWWENPTWTQNTILEQHSGVWLGPVGDVDGDSDLDISFGGFTGLGWSENQRAAASWHNRFFPGVGNGDMLPFSMADMDGDGDADLSVVVIHFQANRSEIRWYANPLDPVSIEEDRSAGTPAGFHLNQNYPNPFNPVTNVRFSIGNSEWVTLKIYTLRGTEVKTLVNARLSPGEYTVQWDGTDQAGHRLPSGMYFYRLVNAEEVQTRKMVLMK